ncbi:hypothetical protein [Fodinibius sp.]|uniref:hypothetical protein n=1 Tax=Fodinibius sp. TaxID=1872440 RepID=UPI002ACD82A7|nr:hypothetical protein [Fodinibius sp.]MDZ7658082.1 hypothetical protein [Fodinibius sp.]
MKALLVELLKMTFTRERGGLIRLRNEDESWDWKAILSLFIRLFLIALVAYGAYYIELI